MEVIEKSRFREDLNIVFYRIMLLVIVPRRRLVNHLVGDDMLEENLKAAAIVSHVNRPRSLNLNASDVEWSLLTNDGLDQENTKRVRPKGETVQEPPSVNLV